MLLDSHLISLKGNNGDSRIFCKGSRNRNDRREKRRGNFIKEVYETELKKGDEKKQFKKVKDFGKKTKKFQIW